MMPQMEKKKLLFYIDAVSFAALEASSIWTLTRRIRALWNTSITIMRQGSRHSKNTPIVSDR